MEHTTIRRVEQFRDRWSSFGGGSGILHLSERLTARDLKMFEIFSSYDDDFLESISPDVSVARWAAGSVLFEEGTYVDLAFWVATGEVSVFLAKVSGGRDAAQPIFQGPPAVASSAEAADGPGGPQTVMAMPTGAQVAMLASMDFDLANAAEVRLGPGEVFGEIGALSGWPQSVTARASSECTLVQIRLPALRKMRMKSRALKDRLDALYRERSLLPQLRACPLFKSCPVDVLEHLASRASLVSSEPGATIVEEGSPAGGFYLVRSGFVGLSQAVGRGRAVLGYLSKGMTFGEVELLVEGLSTARYTASSVGYGELVYLAREDLLAVVRTQPEIEARLWESAVARIKASGFARADVQQTEFLEFALAEGLVEGNSILVMDLDVCTRCDDCVRACAETHHGQPRFVREGEKRGNLLIARSCLHCQDPVCLIGCPTGAIHRANVGDVVEIQEPICIGCGTCAGNCPYDAIVMHDTQTIWPDNALPKHLRGQPRAVASKCDLCYTSDAGPACVRNCPHHCAFRVSSAEEFRQLQTRSGA
jgi:Fe-S-cluster-containing hydrogenase component 2/CRP-like cAMP-binding protein